MAATFYDIAHWFDQGVEDRQAYMIVWCDSYDHSDYPEFHKDRDSAQSSLNDPSSMQRAMECYDLTDDKAEQMAMSRCWALKPGY